MQTQIVQKTNAKRSREKGNTLALVTVCTLILFFVMAYIVGNYSQLFFEQKKTQTAADSAALVAAADLGRIVVNTSIGTIGLLDDSPGTSNPQPVQGINTVFARVRLDSIIAGKLGLSSSTLLYCSHQDLVAAQSACTSLNTAIKASANGQGGAVDKNGNAVDMAADVNNYFQANRLNTGKAAATLKPVLGYVTGSSAVTYTPTPQPATPYDPATVGLSTYQPYTSYAAPDYTGTPFNYQFVAVAASPALITSSSFQATLPKGAAAYLPPTAVQIQEASGAYASESVTPLFVTRGKTAGTIAPGTIKVISTAVCGGGNQYSAPPSGTLMISFVSGGIPDPSSTSVNFSTPASIINSDPVNPAASASGLGAGVGSIGSGYGALSAGNAEDQSLNQWTQWMANQYAQYGESTSSSVSFSSSSGTYGSGTGDNSGSSGWDSSQGVWFQAQNGPVPPTPQSANGKLLPSPCKGLSTTNPAVSLGFGTYDWLKSLGLSPNVKSTVDALTLAPFAGGSPANSGFYNLKARIMSSAAQNTYTFSAAPQSSETQLADNWVPPAYADSGSDTPGIIGGLVNISYGNPAGDPRNLLNWPNDPASYQRQQSNVRHYRAADVLLASNSRVVKVSDGKASTSDGNPVSDLYGLWDSVQAMSKVADLTQMNAWAIIHKHLKAVNSQDQVYLAIAKQQAAVQTSLQAAQSQGNSAQVTALTNQLNVLNQQMAEQLRKNLTTVLQGLPRAEAALINSRSCLTIEQTMIDNMKSLTGMGVQKISSTHYVIAGRDFYPPTRAATAAVLDGTGPAPDGQDKLAPFADWTTPPGANDQSQLVFLSGPKVSPPVAINAPPSAHWLPSAYAASGSAQNPYQQLKFGFYMNGTSPGTGQIVMSVGQDPFLGMSTLQGQAVYQSTQALATTSSTENTPVTTVNSNGTTTTATFQTTTKSVWQVQAMDEFANMATSASYFADMNPQSASGGASAVSPAGWCGQPSSPNSGPSSRPQCPALVSEWQLTCPQATTLYGNANWAPPSVIYHTSIPGNPNPSDNYQGDFSNCHYVTQSQSGSSSSGVAQYWSIGGLNFTMGNPGNSTAVGNGWYVTTSPIYGTYSSYSASAWISSSGS